MNECELFNRKRGTLTCFRLKINIKKSKIAASEMRCSSLIYDTIYSFDIHVDTQVIENNLKKNHHDISRIRHN